MLGLFNMFQAFSGASPKLAAMPGGLETIARTFEPIGKAVTCANLETIALASSQARAVLDLPGRLAACKTPQDVAGETMRYWQTAWQQQLEGSQRIMRAWGALTPMPSAPPPAAAARGRDTIDMPDKVRATPATGPTRAGVPTPDPRAAA